MYRMIITMVFFSLLSGCAVNRALGPIPTDPNEFKLPIGSLKTSYPEIDVYDRDNLIVGYCTPITQLTKLWGEPNEIRTVWFQVPVIVVPIALAVTIVDGVATGGIVATGIVYGMYPKQPQHYIWTKGNYEIDTYVSTEIDCAYEPRIWYWQWKQVVSP